MIETENTVCSKNLCKKLIRLGFRKDSYWVWAQYSNTQLKIKDEWRITDDTYEGDYETYKNIINTYTCSELINILPNSILSESKSSLHTGSSLYGLEIHKTNKDGSYKITKNTEYSVQYKNPIGEILNYTTDKNLADALAKMLCFLIENNLITLNK